MNPKIVDALCNSAEIFYETDQILKELSKRRLLKALTKHSKNQYKLSLKVLKNTRSVLRFYVYKEIYKILSDSDTDLYAKNFQEIEAISDSNGSKRLILPHNVFVFKEYSELIFCDYDITKKGDPNNSKEISSMRHRTMFEDSRIILKKLKKLPEGRSVFEDRFVAYIDLDKANFPFTIRHRKSGDKFYPLGMKKPKKLKDFFMAIPDYQTCMLPLLRFASDKKENSLREAVDQIKLVYEEQGYLLAQVEANQIHAKDSSKVVLEFKIREGKKVRVAKISIDSTLHMSESKIKGKMETKEDRWWRSGDFKEEDFETDLDKIVDFYKEKGFLDNDKQYLRNRLERIRGLKGKGQFHTFYRYN